MGSMTRRRGSADSGSVLHVPVRLVEPWRGRGGGQCPSPLLLSPFPCHTLLGCCGPAAPRPPLCPLCDHGPIALQKIYECLGVYTKDEARMKEFKDKRFQEIVDAGVGAAAPLDP